MTEKIDVQEGDVVLILPNPYYPEFDGKQGLVRKVFGGFWGAVKFDDKDILYSFPWRYLEVQGELVHSAIKPLKINSVELELEIA